jgi:hypothetical protein
MVELRKEVRNLGINVSDLKSAVNIKSIVSGEGKTIIIHDTLERYSFVDTLSSKYLKLSGNIDVKTNKLDYKYTYNGNYSLYSYEYKKKFWKRPELRMKLVSDDKNNQISMETFTIKPPQEIVSVGFGIGAAVYYNNGKIAVAPAITIGIFKPIYTFRTKK